VAKRYFYSLNSIRSMIFCVLLLSHFKARAISESTLSNIFIPFLFVLLLRCRFFSVEEKKIEDSVNDTKTQDHNANQHLKPHLGMPLSETP
jgi:hypothetical protein